jgi:predicted nucleic acid-binding protein
MIVVDSSVWINFIRAENTGSVAKLRTTISVDDIIVGDIILLEVLQGARNDMHAQQLATDLGKFEYEPMLSRHVATKAASNFRYLRSKGITIRKTIDLIIGTFCIENDHQLLHDDHDFEPMAEHLGLKIC